MPHSSKFQSLQDASRATKIEPARIRFIELEFKEFFGGRAAGFEVRSFDHGQIELLRKIHDWVFIDGRSPATVRQLLRRNLRLRTVAITSGKGGVGKTTVAINLSIAMARRGFRTLLVDADMGLGNVHVFAGIRPGATVVDVVEGRATVRQVIVPGPGDVHYLCAGSGITKLADLDLRAVEFFGNELTKLAADFDIVVLDTGAGICAQVMHFLGLADDIVVVATPNIASTLDAYGVVKVSREAALRGRMHLLVNQAKDGFEAQSVFDRIHECAQRFLNYAPAPLGWLPFDPAFEYCNQSRRPLLVAQPEHLVAHRFLHFAGRLCTEGGAPGGGSLASPADAPAASAVNPPRAGTATPAGPSNVAA